MSSLFKKLTMALLTTLIVSTAAAHDDHDHDGPSLFQPQKGGIVKSTETLNLEVVNKDIKLEIYIYNNEGKIKESDTYELKAGMKLPKHKKVDILNLEAVNDSKTNKFSHYEIKNKPKSTHRYTLILDVKEAKADHGDKIEFTIELKK